jgi:hypothetical protein
VLLSQCLQRQPPTNENNTLAPINCLANFLPGKQSAASSFVHGNLSQNGIISANQAQGPGEDIGVVEANHLRAIPTLGPTLTSLVDG